MYEVPNEALLRAGVAHAELELEHWNQTMWGPSPYVPLNECRTKACLAGHILLAQGMTWRALLDLDRTGSVSKTALDLLGFDRNGYVVEGSDVNKFRGQVFGYTYNIKANQSLGYSPGPMKLLKERITETTGIEF